MDIFNIKVVNSDPLLTISQDPFISEIGTQYDNMTQQLHFERPIEYEYDSLLIYFAQGTRVLEPIDIRQSNDIVLTQTYTKHRQLDVQIAFIRDGMVIKRSNTISYTFRPSISNKPIVEIPIEEQVRQLTDKSFIDVDKQGSLLRFLNLDGTVVASIEIDGSSSIDFPYEIGLDGYWYVWDEVTQSFVSTGIKAQGEQGLPGASMNTDEAHTWTAKQTFSELSITTPIEDDNPVDYLTHLNALKTNNSGIIYVNLDSTADFENGSANYPFKTFQEGIDSVGFGDIISIAPGQYNEDIIIEDKHNLTVVADGGIGQFRTVINGDVIIDGTSTRVSLNNLQIERSFVCNSTAGLIYLDNISVKQNYTLSGNGYHRYDFCFFNHMLIDDNLVVDLINCQFENGGILQTTNENLSLSLSGCRNIVLDHRKGNVSVGNNTRFESPYGIDSISSIANIGEGALFLESGTVMQYSGIFGKINKTGNCPYAISTFIYEDKPAFTVLNGTKMDGGLHSNQIYDHEIRTGYSQVGDTLKGHLDGIAAALEEIKNHVGM